MEISYKMRNKIRKTTAAYLESLDLEEGQRIDFPELFGLSLEDLLFETITAEDGKVICKLPVWSGDFLKHIKLENVNFDNVAWSIIGTVKKGTICGDYENMFNITGLSKSTIEENVLPVISDIKRDEIIGCYVNYEGTDAHIDLGKSYEAKTLDNVKISHCNFRGTDLSKTKFKNYTGLRVHRSDVAYTGLPVAEAYGVIAYESDFSGLDLSNFEINYTGYKRNCPSYHFPACCLVDTGIKIKKDLRIDSYDRNAMFTGCYIDGELCKSQKQIKKERDEKIAKLYEVLCNALEAKTADKEAMTSLICDEIQKKISNQLIKK